MGFIRTIKPELLDLECAALLSLEAWRVWVSMFLLADDRGNLRAAPRLLAAHIFHDTGRTDVIERSLVELEKLPVRYRVTLYRHGEELYAHLSGFTDQTSAIGQYERRLAKTGRVPESGAAGSEPARIIPDTCASVPRTEAPPRARRRQNPPRARLICSCHYHRPCHQIRIFPIP